MLPRPLGAFFAILALFATLAVIGVTRTAHASPPEAAENAKLEPGGPVPRPRAAQP